MAAAAAVMRVPGRMDVVGHDSLTVYDGAHHPSGADALATSLGSVVGGRAPRVGVIGVLEDKDAAAMPRVPLPHFDRAAFTRSGNPRSLSPATLMSLAESSPWRAHEAAADPRAALDRGRVLAGPAGAVIATGSIYLIGELLREERRAPSSL